MMNASTSNPTLRDLAHALCEVAPARSVVFAIAFLISLIAKLTGCFFVAGSVATLVWMVALVGLYRKRADIRRVLLAQVASSTQEVYTGS
ncbi:hypothetical protein [Pseudomonas guariconensis]|uniref:hypothetical protein n=1 Tax=Pseudomonas guariconensis TaxID=1288410 RepID=UPI00209B7E42|nr:hypothetical protein [Pseudomonas guariconensis]MCO7620174.1 hypothetical protein [Pseudomonas guariconensis]